MQRIASVYDWQQIPQDQQAVVISEVEGLRLVRLKVNAPGVANLYVTNQGTEIFLARVQGFDEIEFNIDGDYSLAVTGSDVWINTIDGTDNHLEPVSPETFTRIMERQARNPELEMMERRMAENQERRLAAMMISMQTILGQKDAEIAATRNAIKELADKQPTPPASGAAVSDGDAAPGAPGADGSGDDKTNGK